MSPLLAVRITSLLDAASYLLLVGIAVPVKYLGGNPTLVKTLGPVHGALFVALCLALLLAWRHYRWPIRWPLAIFCAALVPVVPFLIDRWIRTRAEGG